MTPTRLAPLILVALAFRCDAVERTPLPAEFVREQMFVTPRIEGRVLRFFTVSRGLAQDVRTDARTARSPATATAATA